MNSETQSGGTSGWRSMLKAPFEWIDTGLDWFERSTLIVCIIAMAAVSVANVLSRNILGSSLLFANDTTQVLLVMVTFMGIGIGARHARHIRVSAIHDLLPHMARKILLIFMNLTTAMVLFLLTSYAWSYATNAQRSCRVLPEAVGDIHVGVLALVIIVLLALFGHGIRLGRVGWDRYTGAFSPMLQFAAKIVAIAVGLMIAWWLFSLFLDLVAAREGRCRIMSSTGFPVYLYYMIVPLGFLLGGIQFLLGGIRNIISRDNYLSWYNKDEYDEVDNVTAQTGLSDEEFHSGEGDAGVTGGRDND